MTRLKHAFLQLLTYAIALPIAYAFLFCYAFVCLYENTKTRATARKTVNFKPLIQPSASPIPKKGNPLP